MRARVPEELALRRRAFSAVFGLSGPLALQFSPPLVSFPVNYRLSGNEAIELKQ